MLLQEPARHRCDWNWRLGSIPVRVHPGFWLVTGLLGLTNGPQMALGMFNLAIVGVWVGAVFVSVLIHELGHALAIRVLGGGRARITLYALGGLTVGAEGRTRLQRLGIIAAGPAFSLLTGLPFLALVLLSATDRLQLPNDVVRLAVNVMTLTNVFWGLLNALPIYPLDGGQILTELITARRPAGGWRLAHRISIGTAVAVAVAVAATGRPLAATLFLYLAFVNYQSLLSDPDA